LFGLLGVAATSGTPVSGFLTMALFGLALSLPLVVFAAWSGLAARLDRLGRAMKTARWLPGLAFVVLGLWSLWFGLYVDPADWAGR
jgi:cytochrome c-type biogenesis protein